MPDFKADNPLERIKLTLADLCNISSVHGSDSVKPETAPLLTGVELVIDRNAPAGSPPTATRYNLVFPASGFLRCVVKVEETTPSITQEVIDKCGGAVRVNIEGFIGGTFLTNDGGARPYFKATKITPVVTK